MSNPDNWTPVMANVEAVHRAAFEAWRHDRQPQTHLLLFWELTLGKGRAARAWIWELRSGSLRYYRRYAERRPPAPFKWADEMLGQIAGEPQK